MVEILDCTENCEVYKINHDPITYKKLLITFFAGFFRVFFHPSIILWCFFKLLNILQEWLLRSIQYYSKLMRNHLFNLSSNVRDLGYFLFFILKILP